MNKIENMIFPSNTDRKVKQYGMQVIAMNRMWDKIQELTDTVNQLIEAKDKGAGDK